VEITDITSDKYEEPMSTDIWDVRGRRQTGGTTLAANLRREEEQTDNTARSLGSGRPFTFRGYGV